MYRSLSCGLVLAVSLGLTGLLVTADDAKKPKPTSKADLIPADAKTKLEEAGLKVSSGGLALPEEAEFAKAIREAAKRKKEMMLADRQVYATQREQDGIKADISELRTQYKNLNTQLAGAASVAENNRLAGAINATVSEIQEQEEKSTECGKRLKECRENAAKIRDEFVEELQKMRTQSEEVTEKWTALAADPAVKEALESVNKALSTKFTLQPATSFAANLKQLKTIEDAVKSDSIKLDNERNSLWVNVMINDKHKNRMIVDSGASTLSISDKMARGMGIKADAGGTPVRVSLADGRTVPGTMVKLDSVKVGKFTVQNVECCVLGADAPDAPPLLGMSFLGQFKFEVDANQAELKLLKVDSGEPVPKELGKEKGKAAKKKK